MSNKKVHVRGSWILVEEIKEVKTSKGGLLLGENDVKAHGIERANVMDVGPATTGEVQVGDVAIYDTSMAHTIDLEGELFRVIPEQYIILIERGS